MAFPPNNANTAAYTPYSDVYGNDANYSTPYDRPAYGRENSDLVRRRQMEDFYRPGNQPNYTRSELNENNLRRYNDDYRGREQSAPGRYPDRGRRSADYSRSSSRSSRHSDSYTEQRPRNPRRSDYFKRQRTQSADPRFEHQGPKHYDGDVMARVQREFDLSADGVFAAALGAGLGAITARRFGESDHFSKNPKHQSRDKWKLIGGAVVGGLIANAAEERYRRYTSTDKEKAEQGKI